MAINVKITGDAQNATNAIAKMEAKVLGLEAKLKEVGKAGKKAGERTTKSFDAKKLLKFAGALVGVGSIAVGLRTVIRLYDEMKRKASEAADASLGIEGNLKRLIQISGGSAARFAELKGQAESLTRKSGIDFNRALGITFQAASLGFTGEEVATFGGFRRFTTEVPSLVGAVGGIRGAFGAQAGGGTIRSIVNSLLAAAEPSRVGVEEIAGQILTPAQIVKKTGGTFEETAAALGIMAVAVKSVEEASVQVGALAKVLGKADETKGLGLIGGVRALLDLPLERQEEIAGRELRASKGFGLFTQNIPAIVESAKDILAAQKLTGKPGSRIALANALARDDPELRAQEARRRAEGGRLITERETLGVPRLQQQAVAEFLRETLVLQGRGAVATGLVEKFTKRAEAFTTPEQFLDLATGIVGRGVRIPGAPQEFLTPSQNRARALAQEAAFAERKEAEADFREAARLLLGSAQAQERAAKALERGVTGGPALGAPTDEMSPVVIGGGT